MNNVNKTLYIPLYGKSYVSRKGILLHDEKAEMIWSAEGFELKGKARSKWLAYYMGMRSAVFDSWLQARMDEDQDAVVLHIGCGMDSRVQRVGTRKHLWFDVDFPEVIQERRRYFAETGEYHMIAADVRDQAWISQVSEGKKKNAIIVMEGVSMYFRPEELQKLLRNLGEHFEKVHLFMDCYTVLAARATKYKNPINEVGVTETYGIDDPEMLADGTGMTFIKEHNLTPEELVRELAGMEQAIFRKVYAGKFAKKLYRLFEFRNI